SQGAARGLHLQRPRSRRPRPGRSHARHLAASRRRDCDDQRLVAYSGVRAGAGQTAEFTPVASYPGLTAEVRARLGEMKVAPVAAETVASEAPLPEAGREVALPAVSVPKAVSPRAKRAEAE